MMICQVLRTSLLRHQSYHTRGPSIHTPVDVPRNLGSYVLAMSDHTMFNATISCLCRKVNARQIPLAHLATSPSQVLLCHCNACRSTSGVLCTSYYSLMISEESGLGNDLVANPYLREYPQSTRLSRWFCGDCGAHVLVQLKLENRYLVAAGIVTPVSPARIPDSFTEQTGYRAVHYGIGETGDGGLSVFMSGSAPGNNSAECLIASLLSSPYSTSPTHLSQQNQHHQGESPESRIDETRLKAQCHCGGTRFTVSRPNALSKKPWSPWSDLIVPFHTGANRMNPEDVKWWLRADDTKYFAGTCACQSCRLASGFPIQCWAFIPAANLTMDQVDEFTFATGTLKRFESSTGVYREFCRTCGATAFWHCDERPGVIDVSVGLLRSEDGARAEKWLEWATERVSFAEDAQDRDLIELLTRGLRNPAY